MSSLGIYFGSKMIGLVEAQGKKVLNNIQISRLTHSMGELGEKVPEELKIVAIFKEELRRNKITAAEANIALSGKDLIIRNFEMPVLSREEMDTAVNFEAKKYIPFRVEDMVSVFQLKPDKVNRQNLVLFAGIKKETLEKYASIFSQLDIKTNIIEYAPFSALRFLQLAGLRYKGRVCIINADLQEENEVNFLVLEDGFPLFCRDISLSGGPEAMAMPEGEMDKGAVMDKLKTEIRVSLDYYNRKFPLKKIEKVFFVSLADYQAELETFIKDIGLVAYFTDLTRYVDRNIMPSPTFIKGYGAALFKTVGIDLKINLLTVKAKAKAARETLSLQEVVPFFKEIKISPWAIVSGIAICSLVFLYFSFSKIQPLEKEITDIKSRRPSVSTISPNANYDQLVDTDIKYQGKVMAAYGLIRKEFYATKLLDVLPRIIPEGMWLINLSLDDRLGKKELLIEGMVRLKDNTKELGLVNNFVSTLKSNEVFSKNFKEITLVYADTRQDRGETITHFGISCRVSGENR